MPNVQWNRRYNTRIGLPSESPDQPATALRLKPGDNDVDEATLARLRRSSAFERLQKEGWLSAGSGRSVPPEGTRGLPPQTVGDMRPALQGDTKAWDPSMSRRDLAEALQSRGVQADAMTKTQLLEALRAYDDDQERR